MDATQTSVLIGAVSAAVGGLLTLATTKGIDAWLRIREDRRKDATLEDQREDAEDEKEDKTLRYIIGIQQGDLASLRTEIKEKEARFRDELTAVYNKHNDCEKRQAALETELRVRMESMDHRMVKVEKFADPKLVVEVHESEAIKGAVSETKAAVREAVHDIKDAVNAASLKAQADAAENREHRS